MDLENKYLPSKKTSQKRTSWGMLKVLPKSLCLDGKKPFWFASCASHYLGHQASSKSRAFSSSWATALALRFLKRWSAKMPWPQESLLCAGSSLVGDYLSNNNPNPIGNTCIANVYKHLQSIYLHTVDGQIIQTLDNFIPRAPQISKLLSSSKGWDGWTKQIKPHSMTYHAHIL